VQSPFSVGEPQREWLKKDLAKYPDDHPIIVFSHSPLYKLYKKWNFWTDDAEEVQAILKRFRRVVVIHGHTHQLLTNRIGNIHFHGMLSTAWPWPYAPEGMPELTIEMSRPDPFNPNDGWRGRRGPRAGRRSRRQGLQLLEPQADHRRQGLHRELGQGERPAAAEPGQLLNARKEMDMKSKITITVAGGAIAGAVSIVLAVAFAGCSDKEHVAGDRAPSAGTEGPSSLRPAMATTRPRSRPTPRGRSSPMP